MFSTVLVVQLLLSLNLSGLYMTYNVGGIKYFDDFNKTWPYIQYKIQKVNFKFNSGTRPKGRAAQRHK